MPERAPSEEAQELAIAITGLAEQISGKKLRFRILVDHHTGETFDVKERMIELCDAAIRDAEAAQRERLHEILDCYRMPEHSATMCQLINELDAAIRLAGK